MVCSSESAKYMVRLSALQASVSDSRMVGPVMSVAVPSGSIRHSAPEVCVIGRGEPSGFRLVCIEPTQKRPWRSHFPSLNRLAGRSASGRHSSVKLPVAKSKRQMLLARATIAPPCARSAIVPTKSGASQVRKAPVDSSRRCTFLSMIPTQ